MEKSVRNAKPESEVLYDYKNPDLSPDERAEDLLKRMTLEEKVAQMLCIWEDKKTIFFDDEGNFSIDKVREHLKNGIGQIARLSDTNGGLDPYQMVEFANKLQKFFVEETRLGIPVIFHEECLHGLAAKDATSYPVPIGLAATFNPELIEKIFSAIAEDARSRGAHQALTPVVDVVRDPRWGRVEETFGEDTYLVSQMGIASVKGLQGDGSLNNNNKVIATLKHFAAHGQPESGTNCAPANFSERFLRDTFLMPFKEAIDKAGVISVMASYNEIDGIPSHANKWLLRKVLRDEWNFKGFVVSDYYAITELFHKEETVSHGVAANKVEAAKLALEAGVNIEFPNPDCYPNLTEMVKGGLADESDIDALVLPMLKYKFELGLFDNPYVEAEPGQFENKLEQDRELALQAARETITLLKNEGNLLPLKDFKKIAVIGPNADRTLLGGYHGTPKYYTSVYQGIKDKVGKNGEVFYSEGCKITVGGSWNDDEVILPDPAEDEKLINEAVAVAQKSDVAVLVLGGNEQTSREAWNKKHLGDRPSLELVGRQNKLVEEILKTGKPVVVLLFNGRPNSIGFIKDNVPAILECWYLGQETGRAVADVLFGDYNPSGKLPVSIPRSAGHIPAHYSHKPSARRGYLFDDVSPLFAFGYGLSYTKFSFDNLRLSKDTISADEKVSVSIEVKNEGAIAGEEVVQLYIRDKVSSVTRPVKELKGFRKITLAPGQTSTVVFELLPEHLAFTNVDMKFTVEPGEFEIMVGNSSRDEDLIKTILTVK
ncbi:glycoside hydrolase family 3 protein [Melioribacter roseus P3M-2]|uniref:Glycoside hydrolase family 3 protein n=1 Tax=Melioribacter roseus (strain DSM 23840 / JCM 17771 / VKM B-2668 / P3M-2) TaxID=1191523 RepID=I7A5Y6_MELRP|nr:glycoside hydrolase family 3 N-terminal domain-containing protein [Melioribacter roseus]AFN75306.1 glycoside hydrolase family 3 protein [Melioribacter roseus P3M-2]